jgi:DNA invertase Pin-like site-specific DNA recombinase
MAENPNSPSDGQIAVKPKHPGGRPRWKFDAKTLEKVEALASRGLTMRQIALALGIHFATLCRKKAKYRVFCEAIEKGKASGIAAVSNKLWDAATGGNITAMIFWLKAQAGWRDMGVDLTVSGEVGVGDKTLSEERERQLKIILAMTQEERDEYMRIVRAAQARAEQAGNQDRG